ncbi:transcriptional regulator [Caballeronia zhejiangensis]|uniref:Transcriptional regulator n=1 Tax=Caballeronia zhejiangensis TaxID=871203 RepID=A0A656QAH6_9BURK|nr:parB-like partition protein [Burkholderia sp. SJ98]KDR26163.1 transcriptional regulator [Caballeronia zhejiangensis]
MPEAARTSPGRLLNAQNRILESDERRAQAESKLADALARIQALESAAPSGEAWELPVEKLHEVAGRRRYMAPEKYAELRENLRHNKLVHPVVVLPRADGEWDIWSGHHRWDAHKDLGKPTIRCVLGTADDEVEATTGAFFANLMQSDLTDYEKYVGLKRFQEGHAGLSQTEVAERAGLSKQFVSELFAFDRLPAEALSVIEANKSMIGSSAVKELAGLTEAGKGQRVIAAVKLLAEKKLDQGQTVKYARATDAPAKPAATPETFKIKAGKTTWCDVRLVKNVMRLEFKDEAEAAEVQKVIREHLETIAKSRAEAKA